ncbi:MAG: Holliday junction helicase RuvB P-loop domain [Candidatus Parcubacteria bacterium]
MITSSKEIQEDSSIDQSLRPQTFEEYIGQDQIKKKPFYLYSSSSEKRRGSRSSFVLWSSGAWEDQFSLSNCQVSWI